MLSLMYRRLLVCPSSGDILTFKTEKFHIQKILWAIENFKEKLITDFETDMPFRFVFKTTHLSTMFSQKFLNFKLLSEKVDQLLHRLNGLEDSDFNFGGIIQKAVSIPIIYLD